MEFQIRKLTAALAEDYVHFFDVTPHNGNLPEIKCYCVTWRSDDSYTEDAGHWFPTPEERREKALAFVKSGKIQGYLAYCGDEVVGWCNANANCRFCLDYLRSFWPIGDWNPEVRIKSVFCFAVAPHMQRKGVATRLLETVCRDAAEEGFDFVEAYVSRTSSECDPDFRGTASMYEKCGFLPCGERDGKIVMRKALK